MSQNQTTKKTTKRKGGNTSKPKAMPLRTQLVNAQEEVASLAGRLSTAETRLAAVAENESRFDKIREIIANLPTIEAGTRWFWYVLRNPLTLFNAVKAIIEVLKK